MELELRELVETKKIIDSITTLFVATDRRDWEAVKSCFAETVLFDMTSMSGGNAAELSPQQIADGWDHGLAKVQQIHHQAGNFRVHLRGTRAEAFCYAVAWHYRETASGRNTRTFAGSYDFELEQTGLDWLIRSFRFNLKFIDGNRELEND